TYRIQFNPLFGFPAARAVIPYLADLGISDLYASPVFKAKRGSAHGYDVVDPNQLNPELGSPSDFEGVTAELRGRGMGWLQDVVPNHMAFDHENQLLMDVLENGSSSKFFDFFDIDWVHPYASITGRVLAPLLGRFYGESLEDGEIELRYDDRGFAIHYYQQAFPLKVESYLRLLTRRLSGLRSKLGGDHPDLAKLLGILYVLRTLTSAESMAERYDQIKFIKKTLWELYTTNQDVRRFIEENVRTFNGDKGNPESLKLLDDLLAEQLFRLSFWKVATEEINYRRFFNINELISLRIEDEHVFNHNHALTLQLVAAGSITGLRVDHIDGLYDPTSYLQRLREKAKDVYLVVEKILDLDEELPSYWPVQGTTGYDFVNYANGVFCRRENEQLFTKLYSTFTGQKRAYEEVAIDKKLLIMGKYMAGDIDNVAHLLKAASSRDRFGSDITLYGLKRALVEVIAHFPVYRTYISKEGAHESDSSYIRAAVQKAIECTPGLLNELRFIERFLLLEYTGYLSEEERDRSIQFVMRFQQFTGPLMAKGFEDTALYVYNRLLSLNEVGGNPDRFGITLGAFHQFNERRARLSPHTLNATSTHDTKRGEDVRVRINVLSEMPKEWASRVLLWRRINSKKKVVSGKEVPDRNDEYFLYQTLVGAFPFANGEFPRFVERMKGYIVKAVREAKVHTAWLKPDQDYEDAYLAFLDEILEMSPENEFLNQFIPFQKQVAYYAIFSSLSQTLIKMTCPGVPDFYQGTELWDLSLVDPDNRRPVDFEKRMALLGEISERTKGDRLAFISELLETREDGRIKLFLIAMGLRARDEYPAVFQRGSYQPLAVSGTHEDHIVAYARHAGDVWAVTIAPRFLATLVRDGEYPLGPDIWRDTRVSLREGLPATCWRNTLTGEIIHARDGLVIAEVLQTLPVALLVNQR
ncbi:MAG TPA: malto-oligosyltrehalose synthase, partial [Syntrophobacteria bacterium]|nr:malto-oligosyltrehalose synthase [Syntrophobacteria bacterium]